MALKPYLQLIRLPNVFTAAADSLAGWLLVMGTFQAPERWLPLLGASMAIYAAGIALNDYFDCELDRVERPNRPLPSGQVPKPLAAWLGGGLLILGLTLAALSGSWASAVVASVLVACVLAYDLGVKQSVLGPEIMGACRALNVLLGMSHAPALGGPAGWLVAASLGLFVVGVTWISRSETTARPDAAPSAGLLGGLALQNLAVLGLIAAAMMPGWFPSPGPDRPIVPIEGLLVLLVVALVVNLANARAVRHPTPATTQHAVKTGVLSLVWLNVGVVAAVRGVEPALAVALLWVPAFLLGRWLYST